ncbi:L-aspartate oxidase [Eubacteriales bacterium OttesenSCG-928-G02]|nr:L-aspartate oxidase [Eubacteriales bacterium OttesenSCG-928-G02]
MNRRFLADLNNLNIDTIDFDVLIVGTGIAGLYSALNLDPKLQCGIITKSNIDESNSFLAQGGIAAVISDDDTYISHIDDTLKAGANLGNLDAIKILVEEGPSDIRRLIDMKIPFDVNPEGDLHITREGGHRARRVVHCGGDATGKETTKQLVKLALEKENLHFFFDTYMIDILVSDGSACGILVKSGDEYKVLRSNNIIIASGGVGQVYKYTSNPLGAIGDGIAACYRAGAVVSDMEFIQFHPTTLISEGKSDRLFLISEAVRGEGAVLKNSQNQAFMQGKHEMADLAPRDIVTREILKELKRTGDKNVFLDVSSMTEEYFSSRFPTIYKECKKRNINVPYEQIPVRPAQHYLMGGVKTDINGCSNIKGLFCCGEVAETGIHGANRLASNSILECLVFGRRSAEYINNNFIPQTTHEKYTHIPTHTHNKKLSELECKEIEIKIKETMSSCAGAVRKKTDLIKAKNIFDAIFNTLDDVILETPDEFKIYNMLTTAMLIVNGAINRKESVGAHYIEEENNV